MENIDKNDSNAKNRFWFQSLFNHLILISTIVIIALMVILTVAVFDILLF